MLQNCIIVQLTRYTINISLHRLHVLYLLSLRFEVMGILKVPAWISFFVISQCFGSMWIYTTHIKDQEFFNPFNTSPDYTWVGLNGKCSSYKMQLVFNGLKKTSAILINAFKVKRNSHIHELWVNKLNKKDLSLTVWAKSNNQFKSNDFSS